MSLTPTSPPDIALPEDVDVEVLVLPREVSSDGVGLYDDSVVTLAKELRSEGVTADYQHGPESRQWIGERAVAEIALAFIIGIFSSAAWDALKIMFSTHYANDRVKGKLARCTQTERGVTWEWFELEGSGEEVARALGELDSGPEPPRLHS